MIGRIDDFLVDRVTQPIADKMARWTTPQATARSLIIGSMVFVLCDTMLDWQAGTLTAADVALTPLALMFRGWFLRLIPPHVPVGQLPLARLAFRPYRWLSIVMDPIVLLSTVLTFINGRGDAILLASQTTLILTSVAMFFAACRNMPPQQRSEVREGKLAPVMSPGG